MSVTVIVPGRVPPAAGENEAVIVHDAPAAIDTGRIAESLRGVGVSSGQNDGQFHQRPAQLAFLGAAEPPGKQLADGVALLGFVDTVLLGDRGQTVFVQQRRQPLGQKQQVALHQPHRDGRGDGSENADAGGVGDGFPNQSHERWFCHPRLVR